MREESRNFSFNAKQLEAIRLMGTLGMPKNISRSMVFLSKVGESTSRDIEKSLKMKQSEVSIVLKAMRERGWVASRSIRKQAKGRPTQIHKLKFPLRRIVKTIEKEKMGEIADIKRRIAKLKSLAK